MTYGFDYKDALEKCGMLSSFEGRDHVGDGGDSLYLRIKITEQDRPLIVTYLERAARELEDMAARIITESSYTPDGFTWEVITERTRWNVNKKLDENMMDALTSYAMMEWLSDRRPDRAAVYKQIWTDMAAMCVGNIYRKNPPSLK